MSDVGEEEQKTVRTGLAWKKLRFSFGKKKTFGPAGKGRWGKGCSQHESTCEDLPVGGVYLILILQKLLVSYFNGERREIETLCVLYN